MEMVDKAVARHGYPVLKDGRVIGTVTSGAKSPMLDAFLALVLVGVFGYLLLQNNVGGTALSPMVDASPQALGMVLFQSYVFPFQVTGVLLLAAIIGVVIFGHTKKRGKTNA